jgi:hypothetical protein
MPRILRIILKFTNSMCHDGNVTHTVQNWCEDIAIASEEKLEEADASYASKPVMKKNLKKNIAYWDKNFNQF